MQAIRGDLWSVFLRLDSKAKPGVYDKLVTKALGKRFTGKVWPGKSASTLPTSKQYS